MDSILRITEKNGAFRAFAADTTELVNKAVSIHGLFSDFGCRHGSHINCSLYYGS